MDSEEDWMSKEEDELLSLALDKLENDKEKLLKKEEMPESFDQTLKSDQTPKKQSRWKAIYPDGGIADSSKCGTTISDKQVGAVGAHNGEAARDKDTILSEGEDVKNVSLPLEGEHLEKTSNTKCQEICKEVETEDPESKDEDNLIAETPLQIYRGSYLRVTDLTAQAWCEQQLVYSFAVPKEVLQTPAMERGTDMHLVKELEVHDIEEVSITTREDSWAVKFLNTFSALTQLLSGSQKIREMPIFGVPFRQGVFFSGIIDEIRWNDKEQLELVEFKTRVKSKTLPSAAQRRTHKLQVSLYKHLFDTAVRGMFKKESFITHLGLNLEKTLSDSVLEHSRNLGLGTDQLSGLVDWTLEKFQFMQQISCLTTEYTSQDDFVPFASESYEYDEEWLLKEVENSLQFWKGERGPMGVDIEDAWKCHHCLFEEKCEWKQKMIEDCIRKNRIKRAKVN